MSLRLIKFFEEARIITGNGTGEIHIAESSDGTFDISLSGDLRLGVPVEGGVHFMYLKEIFQTMNAPIGEGK